MFGIHLTTLQKIEVAVILIILGCAGFFIFRNTRPTFDHVVRTYVLSPRHHPVVDNPAHDARVTTTNPRDPKKDETVIVFACADGRLEISQYPNDSLRHATLKWLPERRQPGLVYQYYQDPLRPVDDIKDPFRHALAYATYNKIYGKSLDLLNSVGLSAAQITQAKAASDQMMNEITIINAACDGGTYHPELLDQVIKALAAYNAKAGDPETDSAKAALAHKVLQTATLYMNQVQAGKDQAIDQFVTAVEKLLDPAQQQKLIDTYKALTQPNPRPAIAARRGAAAGAGTPPARGAAGTRGAAATRGGAGAATATRGPAIGTNAPANTRGGAATSTRIPAGTQTTAPAGG